LHGDGSNVGVRADADDHGGRVLCGPAVAATVFANEFGVAEIHFHAGAVAVPAREFFGGTGSAIPADEADGDHAAAQATRVVANHRWYFVVVEIEQGLVGVDERDVLPSVAIIVQHGKAPAVRRIIQPREAGDIRKGAAAVHPPQ